MGNGSGVSRGDRNRNALLEQLRVLVPVTNATAGINLGGKKQMVVVNVPGILARRWTGPPSVPRPADGPEPGCA